MSMNKRGKSLKSALIAAVLSIVTAAASLIYGLTYSQYLDVVVILCLAAGGVLLAVYAVADTALTYWFGLAGVLVSSYGLGLFIVNIYNVVADTWGNLSQYGTLTGDYNFFNSEGGPVPVVVIIVLGLLAALAGIVSCFAGEREVAK